MAREKYEGLWGGLYNRNEVFLVLSTMIFICSIFVGYAFAGMLEPILVNVFGTFHKGFVKDIIQIDTVSLITHNLNIIIMMYLGGILFGLGTAYLLIYNGLFLGYAGSQFELGNFILSVMPHIVFEVVGFVIVGAAGFKLANVLFNIMKGVLKLQSDFSIVNQFNFLLEVNYDDFKDTLIMIGIAIVLVSISAIVEANITPAWIDYIHTFT